MKDQACRTPETWRRHKNTTLSQIKVDNTNTDSQVGKVKYTT